ncbi:MAG: hypothetical protein K8J31_30175 [Anaerolineae bacterium]|nr:hypothetical protein [Anaerolineae bacterium]
MTEQNNPQPRIFKIGATTIVEDDSLTGKTLDEVKDILKRSYPEVAHATVRERTLDDGTQVVEWLAQAGRKG